MKNGFTTLILCLAILPMFSCADADWRTAKTRCPCVSGWSCVDGGCVKGGAGKDDVQTCTPKTCADQGWACGTGDNGCGGTVDCGTCDSGKTCVSTHKCLSTWKDPATNYVWQVNPSDNNGNGFSWQDAMDYCKGLGSGWHLPLISELRTLIRGCNGSGQCGNLKVSKEDCNSCDSLKGPGPNGVYGPSELKWVKGYNWYWSSSSVSGYSDNAWGVFFDDGYVDSHDKVNYNDARCVRLGP